MAYADNLSDETITGEFLIKLFPRRIPTGFELVSAGTYKTSFNFGEVVAVEQDGVSLTKASSSSLGASEFFYDVDTEELFVRTDDSTDPDTKFMTAEYEINIGTFNKHWHRLPTDDTSRQVFWEPVVLRSPNIKQTLSDSILGFLPTQTSTLALINAEHIFEKHVFDSSFNKASIEIYHLLGDLQTDNLKRIFAGKMGDINYTGGGVNLKLFDRVDEFDTEYRHASTNNFFNTSDFPSLDPNVVGNAIRYVYGFVDGARFTNIDYVEAGETPPTTSDNRNWAVRADGAKTHAVTATIQGGSTTTSTILDDATGFQVDDSAWFDKAVDDYKLIDTVDYGTNTITHSALNFAGSAGEFVKRGTVGNIKIVQQEKVFSAMFDRDWTESVTANDVLQIDFKTTLEANLGLSENLSPADTVFGRIYGKKNDVTLGGSPFGSDDTDLGNLTNPVVILWDILTNFLGLDESELDGTTFTAIVSTSNEPSGFSIPENSFSQSFPTFKTIMIDFIDTLLLKLYIDDDNLWAIDVIAPLTAEDKTIADDEILERTFKSDFRYKDVLSDVIVSYRKQEINNDGNQEGGNKTTTSTSQNAKLLHKISKQKTFDSLHINAVDAQKLADRLGFIFGERKGLAAFATKNRFFDVILSDIILINRTKLPGFDFDSDTLRTRKYSVIESTKGLRRTTFVINDQKGIEDNSGSW